MPRTRDDDFGDYSPPKPRSNTLMYVVLSVFGVLLLTCIGAPLALTLMWRDMERRDEQARIEIGRKAEAEAEAHAKAEAAERKAKVYPRDEFRDLVTGKTESEVIDQMGPPDRKEDKGPENLTYFYDKKTTDPATSKTDATTAVKFKFGRVDSVRY